MPICIGADISESGLPTFLESKCVMVEVRIKFKRIKLFKFPRKLYGRVTFTNIFTRTVVLALLYVVFIIFFFLNYVMTISRIWDWMTRMLFLLLFKKMDSVFVLWGRGTLHIRSTLILILAHFWAFRIPIEINCRQCFAVSASSVSAGSSNSNRMHANAISRLSPPVLTPVIFYALLCTVFCTELNGILTFAHERWDCKIHDWECWIVGHLVVFHVIKVSIFRNPLPLFYRCR